MTLNIYTHMNYGFSLRSSSGHQAGRLALTPHVGNNTFKAISIGNFFLYIIND